MRDDVPESERVKLDFPEDFDWQGFEQQLDSFNKDNFGTTDYREIAEMGRLEITDEAKKSLTGMNDEQADWEEGECDDDGYIRGRYDF